MDFQWEAALEGEKLTRADLKELAAAAEARRELVRVRGRWVQVRAEDVQAVLARVGRKSKASAGELLRAGLGLGTLGEPEDLEIHGVEATGWLGMVLDEALHARIDPVAHPAGFNGDLRAYQARGVGG